MAFFDLCSTRGLVPIGHLFVHINFILKEIMDVAGKIWVLEQQTRQVLTAAEDVQNALITVQHELKTRINGNAASLQSCN